jgi:putative nucleotidyltransferase with HDIG domain
MQIRLHVSQLTKGMYVSELDIPWLESPFLFQGFVIETDEELALLGKHCQCVVVDDMKSRDDIRLRTLLSHEMRRATRAVGARDSSATVVMQEIRGLRAALNRVSARHDVRASRVIRVIDDVRLGRILETHDAKAVVADLVETVSGDGDAAWLLSSIRERSSLLADHCLNSAIIAIAFAQHLGYGNEMREAVGLGAMLHDVGLARVPRTVIEKPRELNSQEQALVRLHPAHGARVLREAREDLPREAVDIVLMHHEKLNGRGYPLGKRVERLPEYVQVVALADMYDSMISERPYAPARSPQVVLSVIHARSGIDFERSLVEEFIRCVGIYPVGSLVELGNRALGIVVSSRPESRLTPTLLMVRDPEDRDILPRKMVNLGVLPEMARQSGWSVARIVDARTRGLNVQAIVREVVQEGSSFPGVARRSG